VDRYEYLQKHHIKLPAFFPVLVEKEFDF
jgi:hypothetical protein